MFLSKQKKNKAVVGSRLLISITVIGSAGPIRFVVNDADLVAAVIQTALKSYARECRLPVLGSDLNSFVLYSPAATEALSPWETIGSSGVRNFMLCRQPQPESTIGAGKATVAVTGAIARKSSRSWRSWLNVSRNRKISSH